MSPVTPGIALGRDGLGRADLGSSRMPLTEPAERPDHRELQVDQLRIADGVRGVRAELAAEILAMVQGEDDERAATPSRTASGPGACRAERASVLQPSVVGSLATAAASCAIRCAVRATTVRELCASR
jgi:hypothetical protein